MNAVSRNSLIFVLLFTIHSNAIFDLKIVGGVIAEKHEFPWLVNVRVDRLGLRCGGSIIDKDWVLTAAHCVTTGGSAEIYAGEHNIVECDRGRQKVKSCQIIQHENYSTDNGGALYNDIALIKLSKSLQFSDTVKAIALPLSTHIASGDVTVAGWGTICSGRYSISSVLLKANVTVISEKWCQHQYAPYFFNITNDMICTARPGKDSCRQGDSGGPLMCNSEAGHSVCGIVSFGSGVYANVARYLTWINTTISSSENCTSPGLPEFCNSGKTKTIPIPTTTARPTTTPMTTTTQRPTSTQMPTITQMATTPMTTTGHNNSDGSKIYSSFTNLYLAAVLYIITKIYVYNFPYV